jgi:hypothetical protein
VLQHGNPYVGSMVLLAIRHMRRMAHRRGARLRIGEAARWSGCLADSAQRILLSLEVRARHCVDYGKLGLSQCAKFSN